MATVSEKKNKTIELELLKPDFSSLKDSETGEDSQIINWSINFSNDMSTMDSLNLSIMGIPYINNSKINFGQEISLPIKNLNKSIKGAVKKMSHSLDARGLLITNLMIQSLGSYLDTKKSIGISSKEKKLSSIILSIYKELSIDIEYDSGSDDLEWVMDSFNIGAHQSILEYIESALKPAGHNVIKWWIDLFGNLRIYKLLSPPADSSFTLDISTQGPIIQSMNLDRVDFEKQKAALKNLQTNDTDETKSKEVEMSRISTTKGDASFNTTVKDFKQRVLNTKGVTMNTPALVSQNLTKITQELFIDLKGTHFILPQTKVIIKNSPFGNGDYVCKTNTIQQSQNGDSTTSLVLENDL